MLTKQDIVDNLETLYTEISATDQYPEALIYISALQECVEHASYENLPTWIEKLEKILPYSMHSVFNTIATDMAQLEFRNKLVYIPQKNGLFKIVTAPLDGVEIKFNSVKMMDDMTIDVDYEVVTGRNQTDMYPDLTEIFVETAIMPVLEKAIASAEAKAKEPPSLILPA